MLIYIHGFNNSPASFRVQLLRSRLELLRWGTRWSALALDEIAAA
jgi:predicted esterase YcpF (UPF0227 family)